MRKILFVCLGNICRSPLAEGILLKLNTQKQLGLSIDSAGTSSCHVGEAPDPRTVANALKNGVDLRNLRARQFETEDFDRFDVIYVMDKNNLKTVLAQTQSEVHKNKVKLFLEESGNVKNAEVPDPYYGTETNFEAVFQLLYSACNNWCTLMTDKKI